MTSATNLKFPDYADRAPWWGGDLQTIRNQLVEWRFGLLSIEAEEQELHFPVSDGTGDTLTAKLNEPANLGNGPTVLLIHGLTGCEDSTYMRRTAAFHVSLGRRVIRLNLRGAGPSRAYAGGYYFGGCTSDIQDVIDGLEPALLDSGLFIIGYSLGGNILMNYLGQLSASSPLIGAATVSAPLRPSEACARLMEPRNRLYHSMLLGRMKREALSPYARLSDDERQHIQSARSIFEFDDLFTAPRHGYGDAVNYYAMTAGEQFVGHSPVPVLLIHAANDPWVPASPYRELQARCHENATIVVSAGGGHVGFHDRVQTSPWHDRAIDLFLSSLAIPTRKKMP